jgi:hypothetical protein
MPDAPIHIGKAELQQFLQWLRDIEDVQFIDKNIEEETYTCLDRCNHTRKILNKMPGLLTMLQ